MQDFRSHGLKGRNMRTSQLCPQVVAQQIGFDLVERLVELLSFDAQRKPGMIATRQMIALRTCFAALALLCAGQLLQPTVQFFNLPTHVVRVLSDLRSQSLIGAIRNHPVNVAVCGNQLE